MDTSQILKIFKFASKCLSTREKVRFTGVYPINFVKSANLYVPGELRACVVNQDKNFERGSHWFVVIINCKSDNKFEWHAEIFDSLAQNVRKKYPFLFEYLTELKSAGKIQFVLRNTVPTQSKYLDSCGLMSLYVILNIIRENASFESILGSFNASNTLVNDCELLRNFQIFLECEEQNSALVKLESSLKETVKKCESGE